MLNSIGSIAGVLIVNPNTEVPSKVREMYEAEGCGVCEQSGAEVFWFSPNSRCAHAVCYVTIEKIEADLIAKINALFVDSFTRNLAHIRAIKAVKKELGGVTIKKYLETNGPLKLKAIFDSAGLAAALTPPAKL